MVTEIDRCKSANRYMIQGQFGTDQQFFEDFLPLHKMILSQWLSLFGSKRSRPCRGIHLFLCTFGGVKLCDIISLMH